MTHVIDTPEVDLQQLRQAIQAEYALVAQEPDRGFHFHTGRLLAALLGYDAAWLRRRSSSSGAPCATWAPPGWRRWTAWSRPI